MGVKWVFNKLKVYFLTKINHPPIIIELWRLRRVVIMTQTIITKKLETRLYRLTTAEILYHMPDYQHLLQSFVWQEVDTFPHFPLLNKFVQFWQSNLDGKIHSVTVSCADLFERKGFRFADEMLTMQ